MELTGLVRLSISVGLLKLDGNNEINGVSEVSDMKGVSYISEFSGNSGTSVNKQWD